MKKIFFCLLMFPAVIFAQPKIYDIIWVGQNKEYFAISKKEAVYRKGQHGQEFKVVKYVKDNYIILSSEHIFGHLEQKYYIISFTENTLVLAPDGRDIFKLCRPNEENQYVFVNSLNTFTFEKLRFETSFEYFTITLDIDVNKNSRVKIHDDYMNDTKVVTSAIGKYEYRYLIQILAACDIDSFPENYDWTDDSNVACCHSVFHIHYDNNQLKKCKGCSLFPFDYPPLENFIWDYINGKAGTSSFGPDIRLLR